MMNKSKIQWTDFSWNPITGCYHICEYCYARRQAQRFSGDVRINLSSDQIRKVQEQPPLYSLAEPFHNANGRVTPCPAGFAPTLHEYRLTSPAEKKKPANIFVCSMADLFGAWVPDEWIRRVFDACDAAPQHNYLFLTKNNRRYEDLYEKGMMPKGVKSWNKWYGCTITKEDDEFFYIDEDQCGIDHQGFLSIEPLLGPFKAGAFDPRSMGIHWIIVGCETGNRSGKVTPKREWIEALVKTAHDSGVPILLKDSKEMRAVWGDELITEFPKNIARIKETYK